VGGFCDKKLPPGLATFAASSIDGSVWKLLPGGDFAGERLSCSEKEK
jgi:hypothetical protein